MEFIFGNEAIFDEIEATAFMVKTINATGNLSSEGYLGADFYNISIHPVTGDNVFSIVSATELVKGIARIATNTEMVDALDDTTIITPLKLHDKFNYINVVTRGGGKP